MVYVSQCDTRADFFADQQQQQQLPLACEAKR